MNTLLKSLDNTTVRSDELDNVRDSIIRWIERLDSFRGKPKVSFRTNNRSEGLAGKSKITAIPLQVESWMMHGRNQRNLYISAVLKSVQTHSSEYRGYIVGSSISFSSME